MVVDERSGRPHSDTGTVATADSNTTITTALTGHQDYPFSPESIRITYTGTATTVLTVHDDPDGTSAANLSDPRVTVELTGSERNFTIDLDGERDFLNDVLLDPDGAQDADITVEVRGYIPRPD